MSYEYPTGASRMILAGFSAKTSKRGRSACAEARGDFEWLWAEMCLSRRADLLDPGASPPPVLRSAGVVSQFIHDVFPRVKTLAQEALLVIGVDNKNRPVGVALVNLGTLTSSITGIPELLRPILLLPATGGLIVHNHPSGEPGFSADDNQLTWRWRDAMKLLGLRALDHIVVTHDPENYFSAAEAGIMMAESPPRSS